MKEESEGKMVYDEELINNIDNVNLLAHINANVNISGITKQKFQPTSHIGSLVRDETGKIVGAKALLINFIEKTPIQRYM